jgi:hypothetical protein
MGSAPSPRSSCSSSPHLMARSNYWRPPRQIDRVSCEGPWQGVRSAYRK